eukprot:2182947-Pyramimonas_sp.AAC.1
MRRRRRRRTMWARCPGPAGASGALESTRDRLQGRPKVAPGAQEPGRSHVRGGVRRVPDYKDTEEKGIQVYPYDHPSGDKEVRGEGGTNVSLD